MKKFTLVLLLAAFSLNAQAAKFEESDVVGRLFAVDQETGSVQASIVVTSNGALGNLTVDVSGIIDGAAVNTQCTGSFQEDSQSLEAVCDSHSKVLVLKLKNDNDNLIYFINGKLSEASITYVQRPLKDDSKKITVDVKKLK
jgi:hypothetical protein